MFNDFSKSYCRGLFAATPVIIDNNITRSVRCRKHKKRRIDKKWLKRYGYKEVQDDTIFYQYEGKLIMSQKAFDKVNKCLS